MSRPGTLLLEEFEEIVSAALPTLKAWIEGQKYPEGASTNFSERAYSVRLGGPHSIQGAWTLLRERVCRVLLRFDAPETLEELQQVVNKTIAKLNDGRTDGPIAEVDYSNAQHRHLWNLIKPTSEYPAMAMCHTWHDKSCTGLGAILDSVALAYLQTPIELSVTDDEVRKAAASVWASTMAPIKWVGIYRLWARLTEVVGNLPHNWGDGVELIREESILRMLPDELYATPTKSRADSDGRGIIVTSSGDRPTIEERLDIWGGYIGHQLSDSRNRGAIHVSLTAAPCPAPEGGLPFEDFLNSWLQLQLAIRLSQPNGVGMIPACIYCRERPLMGLWTAWDIEGANIRLGTLDLASTQDLHVQRNLLLPPSPRLANAMRWYESTYSEQNPEDFIVKIVIAGECLCDKGHSDIALQFSIFLSMFASEALNGTHRTRDEWVHSFKALYDLRSLLVHGTVGKERTKALSKVGLDSAKGAEEFQLNARDLIRHAILGYAQMLRRFESDEAIAKKCQRSLRQAPFIGNEV